MPIPSYFVVMIDYGSAGREAVVDPDLTRADVVDRVRSREYDRINFIHHVHDGVCEDVTNDVLKAAGFYERDHQHVFLKLSGMPRATVCAYCGTPAALFAEAAE